MGELIEHSDNGDGNIDFIRVGEAKTPVSVKVYQDIYHQVTGRTEQIRERYSDNILVEFSEIEQLHIKIKQLCDIHKIVACNEVISVFHEKERKEQFTSFDRFCNYNSNAASPTVSMVLKYNFSIIPAGLDAPQEYVVSIRLTSRVAMLQQIEKDVPRFVGSRFLGIVALNTAEVTIEYADYVIARGFLEAFDEWIRGCRKTTPIWMLNVSRKWSEYIPGAAKIISGFLITWCAFQTIPIYFNPATTQPDTWARFFVVFAGAALILVPLMGSLGTLIEEAIDGFPVLSYLKLNRGDANLIDDFSKRKKTVLVKLVMSSISTVLLGILSAKLEQLL